MPRRDHGRFDDLLSQVEAERLITSTAARTPAFRLVKAGAAVGAHTEDIPWRPRPFTGTIDVRRAIQEFERGATIVLQALHVSHAPLAAFARQLEAGFRHPVQVNAYYTPRAAQGLPVHHDTHDVFVLQVAGEKRWRVYAPALELPLRTQRYSTELGEPRETLLDVTMGPGDTLYLPRGWLHEALTSETDSLHLTVGVNVVTWLDAMRAALDECADDLRFRRSVDAGDPDELVETLRGRLVAGDIDRRRSDWIVRRSRPLLEDGFQQVRALREFTVDTTVVRRPAIWRLHGHDPFVLEFDGIAVRLPARVQEELEFLAGTDGPVTVAELPGQLDDESRLVLVRRLVREGFLRAV
ncbi:MAG: cupin domain-containing protein [Gaiellaceae bacterium]